MSAARTSDTRRDNRKAQASPYARPDRNAKKSSWAFSLNPMKNWNPMKIMAFWRSPTPPPPDTPSELQHEHESDVDPMTAVVSKNMASHEQMELRSSGKQQILPPHSAKPSSSTSNLFANSSAPSILSSQSSGSSLPIPPPGPGSNIDAIGAYLRSRRISEIEVEGILDFIQQAPANKPFRFETPLRSSSPSSSTVPQSTSLPTLATPHKTLSKNPNGTPLWRGGGSSKRSRNRYHSPAFGPSRSAPERLKLSASNDVPPDPRTDTKRRRVGEDTASALATPSGAPVHNSTPPPQFRAGAPAPSPTRAAQAVPFPISTPLSPSPSPSINGTSNHNPTTPSRLRIPPKPTAPAIPSPLRQAWSQTPNDPSPESTPQPQRQTKAATIMTELIRDHSPPKKPDLSNPYQTASPVKTPAAPVRPRPKRPRATGKPTTPQDKKDPEEKNTGTMSIDHADVKQTEEKPKSLDEYSPQAIIEATVPKGSKRSRPTFDAPAVTTIEMNGASQEKGDDQSPKRLKVKESESSKIKDPLQSAAGCAPPASPPSPSKRHVSTDEARDVDMLALASKDAAKPIVSNAIPNPGASPSSGTSGPTPPSPTLGKSLFGAPKTSSIPKEPSKLRFSYQPDPPSAAAPIPASEPAPGLPPTPKLAPAEISGLPSMVNGIKHAPTWPDIASSSKDLALAAKAAALAIPKEELPQYEFRFAGVAILGAADVNMDPVHVKARNAAKALPKESLPTFDFSTSTWEKATKSSSERNVSDTKVASVPKPAVSTPPMAFNWGAVGLKVPTPTGGASWTCSTCMLSNPATATEKCTVCDSPR